MVRVPHASRLKCYFFIFFCRLALFTFNSKTNVLISYFKNTYVNYVYISISTTYILYIRGVRIQENRLYFSPYCDIFLS